MADYIPPTQNLPIFDTTVFTEANDSFLTYDKASKLFLTFPIAQGDETLQGITVQGPASFNSSAIAQTPITSDNSTKIATTAFVKNQAYAPLGSNNTFTGTNAFTNTNTTAVTQVSTDNSTKVATTAYVKSIASPANFLGLANSFFYSFIYDNNPTADYMIASNLGGLVPNNNPQISTVTTTTFILQGVRLQGGIVFNKYGWNQQTIVSPMRCALYTSGFQYVPGSLTAFSTIPNNNGGATQVTLATPIVLPTTDTYYIYLDGNAALPTTNNVYGANTSNQNVMNYIDVAPSAATFTASSTTPPFKSVGGTKGASDSPDTTMTDLTVAPFNNMTYLSYIYSVFLRYTA